MDRKFVPDGFRLRVDWRGKLVLQVMQRGGLIHFGGDDGWRDAMTTDVVEWGPWSIPPNEGTGAVRDRRRW